MNDDRERVRREVHDALRAIAPEADPARIDARRSLREQLDLDSYDYLNLLVDLHARLGVDVPEADYGRIDALDALVDYLAVRVTPSP